MNTSNFFILGAEKCGTTSLYYYLNQHPDVYFSIPKEPIFFEAEYEQGLSYYWNRYFSKWNGEKVVGEARHRNLYLPYVANRIKESIKNPKFIVIVRHPIERAYSHWLRRSVSGAETLPFKDAIFDDIKRIEHGIIFEGEEGARLWKQNLYPAKSKKGVAVYRTYRTYIDSGYYSQQIRRYLKLFPKGNMKIIFLDDLKKNPQTTISDLWSFLSIDPQEQLIDLTPQNVSKNKSNVRKLMYGKTGKMTSMLPNPFKRVGWKMIDKIGIQPAPIKSSLRKNLINHYYDHNRDLEKLTGRDLTHWDK